MSTSKPNRRNVDKGPKPIMRLNKYVASCGIGSRRKAAEWVKEGLVQVNGKIETNPAYEVKKRDVIKFKGKVIKLEKRLVYILLNKPKDTITTMEDDRNRKTVHHLIRHKIRERVFPVGRLDRNTTGLLLMTNDGDLAQRLAHPKFQVTKLYEVELDRALREADLEAIRAGLNLEDGLAQVDGIDYVEGKTKHWVGITLHIGRNRIVRRIFEHLGYQVVKLDRVYYGGLTKKDIPRGRFRHLSHKEVIMLKHFKG